MPAPNYGYFNPYMPTYPAYGYSPVNAPPVMPQSQPQAVQPQQTQPQQEQLVNGGLVVVASEDDVIRYPVAPGNTVTLENQPTIIEKSMGRSQFASPAYERYKLVREEIYAEENRRPEGGKIEAKGGEYVLKSELEEVRQSVEKIHQQIDSLKSDLIKTRDQLTTPEQRAKEGEKL